MMFAVYIVMFIQIDNTTEKEINKLKQHLLNYA